MDASNHVVPSCAACLSCARGKGPMRVDRSLLCNCVISTGSLARTVEGACIMRLAWARAQGRDGVAEEKCRKSGLCPLTSEGTAVDTDFPSFPGQHIDDASGQAWP